MKDLSELDVLDLDTGELYEHDELITLSEATSLFSGYCKHCGQQTGISYAQIRKAASDGHIVKYTKYGGRWKGKQKGSGREFYLNYYDVKEYIEKQKRIKGRKQW